MCLGTAKVASSCKTGCAAQGVLNALVMGYNVDQAITQGLIGGALGGAAGGALGWGINKLMNMGSTKAGNTAKGETSSQDFLIAAGDDRKVVFGAMISF